MDNIMKYDYADYRVNPSAFADSEEYEQWCSFNLSSQMIEIYGEAARLARYKDEKYSQEDIDCQWNSFAKKCGMSFADPSLLPGEKEELFDSYLEFKDYIYADDPVCKNRKSVMKWFEQWMGDWHLSEAGLT
jgi:hypothetical protein